ncbi:MAG: hypothetical protein JXR96_14685 [Deltaproteobacteria bacterium]|nr:hypothetical protein [Deltaproteobacteria bacterium]
MRSAVLLLSILLAACDGESIELVLDSDFKLLRHDLKDPGRYEQALSLPPTWGRAGRWLPDARPWQLLPTGTTRAPGQASEIRVQLVLDPAAGSLTGRAELVLGSEDEDIARVELLLSAAAIDELDAQAPDASFEYRQGRLIISPTSPVPAGQSWPIAVEWHDQDIELYVDDFPEQGGRVLANRLSAEGSFFSYGYWYWPVLIGQARFEGIEIEVTFPDSMTLVLPGELVGSQANADSTRSERYRFDTPHQGVIPLALGSYEQVAGACGDAVLELYALPGSSSDGYPIVPATYVPILEAMCEDYRSRFGEPAFGVLRFAGVDEAFENGFAGPGLTLVPNYVWDDDGSGSFIKRDFYLAHELSHTWWGNEVFVGASRDLWLLEGMADYCAASCLTKLQGEQAGSWTWRWEVQPLLEHYTAGGADHPLVPDEAIDMEPRIYYIKGAWVLRMLGTIMGAEDLDRLLLEIQDAHAFDELETEQLTQRAAEIAAEDLDWFFEQWLRGTGIISVREEHRGLDGDRLECTVTQRAVWATGPERYFQMPMDVKVEHQGREHQETVWLEGVRAVFELPVP